MQAASATTNVAAAPAVAPARFPPSPPQPPAPSQRVGLRRGAEDVPPPPMMVPVDAMGDASREPVVALPLPDGVARQGLRRRAEVSMEPPSRRRRVLADTHPDGDPGAARSDAVIEEADAGASADEPARSPSLPGRVEQPPPVLFDVPPPPRMLPTTSVIATRTDGRPASGVDATAPPGRAPAPPAPLPRVGRRRRAEGAPSPPPQAEGTVSPPRPTRRRLFSIRRPREIPGVARSEVVRYLAAPWAMPFPAPEQVPAGLGADDLRRLVAAWARFGHRSSLDNARGLIRDALPSDASGEARAAALWLTFASGLLDPDIEPAQPVTAWREFTLNATPEEAAVFERLNAQFGEE